MSFKITLSTSKIKTAHNCSWLYWVKYGPTRLPDASNSGAKTGSIVHIVLECLAVNKRRKLAEKIIKSRDPFHGKACQGIKHLVYKWARKLDIDTPEHIDKIKTFIVNGLSHDFWGEDRGKPIATYTEKDFDFEVDGRYKTRGFIDRLFIYAGGHALIRDYKSSKSTYCGSESTTENHQGSNYCLAVREMSGKGLIPKVTSVSVEFLFLKFDCSLESKWETGIYQGRETKKLYHNGGGRITLNYDWAEIAGFEYELEADQQYLENFTEEDAAKNFAADKPDPSDGSFGGKMMCGFCSQPGELKKDGSPKYSCAARWPFNYYHILNKDDNSFVASCFLHEREKLEYKYPHDRYLWIEKSYGGCKRWMKNS